MHKDKETSQKEAEECFFSKFVYRDNDCELPARGKGVRGPIPVKSEGVTGLRESD